MNGSEEFKKEVTDIAFDFIDRMGEAAREEGLTEEEYANVVAVTFVNIGSVVAYSGEDLVNFFKHVAEVARESVENGDIEVLGDMDAEDIERLGEENDRDA